MLTSSSSKVIWGTAVSFPNLPNLWCALRPQLNRKPLGSAGPAFAHSSAQYWLQAFVGYAQCPTQHGMLLN
jgi:hypothetical protein